MGCSRDEGAAGPSRAEPGRIGREAGTAARRGPAPIREAQDGAHQSNVI